MPDTKVQFNGIADFAFASQSEAQAGASNTKLMTPLRVKNAIDANVLSTQQSSIGIAYKTFSPFRFSESNPNTSITISALPFFLDDKTNAVAGSEFSKRITGTFVAGNGNGGLDTGTVAPNTTYYVWIISNSTNNTVDALFSLSATSPTMPSGFTKKVRVGVAKTDNSSNLSILNVIITESVGNNNASQVFEMIECNQQGITSYVIKHGANFTDTSTRFLFSSAGDFTATGNITAYSDESLKKDIKKIESALDKVLALQGVEYIRKSNDRKEVGLIAQEVEKVIPEVVLEVDGLKSVAYANLIALVIEAIKELNDKIEGR